ncbi:MAG: TIGR02281 family clan AA aspartic protease [Pseudohongiellaceae bacterium]
MNPRKTGTGMIAVAFIIGIAMLTMFFGGVEQRQRNPNQSPESRVFNEIIEVNLSRNRQGHYIVTGTINNRPVEFLLDTGATDVVVPEAIATSLGLERGRPGRAMTANGYVTVYRTVINRLSIGDIVLHNVRASINPAMPPPAILLGMSALTQIEFVQQGDSLTLRQLPN